MLPRETISKVYLDPNIVFTSLAFVMTNSDQKYPKKLNREQKMWKNQNHVRIMNASFNVLQAICLWILHQLMLNSDAKAKLTNWGKKLNNLKSPDNHAKFRSILIRYHYMTGGSQDCSAHNRDHIGLQVKAQQWMDYILYNHKHLLSYWKHNWHWRRSQNTSRSIYSKKLMPVKSSF